MLDSAEVLSLFQAHPKAATPLRSMPDIVTPQTMWQVAQEILEEVDVSKDGLLLRFEDIGYPTGSKFTTVSAMKKKNRMCNRYSNILPWDHNGVKIHSSEAEGKRGRYINASLLKVRDM